MTDYKQQLSDLESLAYAVDYDMGEYDQTKVDDLAKAAQDMAIIVQQVFGVNHYDLSAIINNAKCVSDTDRDEWEGNHL